MSKGRIDHLVVQRGAWCLDVAMLSVSYPGLPVGGAEARLIEAGFLYLTQAWPASA